MKKILLILLALGCASCQLENKQPSTLAEMWQQRTEQPQTAPKTAAPVQNATTPMAASAPKYASDADRYRQNIVVKAAGENYVVYEYSDVRVDDVASLASAYCFENTNGLKAYLRDIYMYRNNKRRATFDCASLASN